LDLQAESNDTERGSEVKMKFTVERQWIKSVRCAKNKPNYGMTNLDSILEEVVGNKLELCGPPLDSFLREIGRD